jgi:hypothetical protein
MAEPEEEGGAAGAEAGRGAHPHARGPQGAPAQGESLKRADPELEARLEALRRSSGLRLDREGRWLHEGRPVRHKRLAQALHQGIDRHPETGETIVRIGAKWCYVEVEDAPYVVRSARVEGDRVELLLSDDSWEVLDPATLRIGAGGVPYATVKDGRFRARFSRAAYQALIPHLEEEDGLGSLRLGARRIPLGREP